MDMVETFKKSPNVHLSMETKLVGTICTWGSIFCGSFVQWDRKWGTGSPGIKWVRDQMRRSQIKFGIRYWLDFTNLQIFYFQF